MPNAKQAAEVSERAAVLAAKCAQSVITQTTTQSWSESGSSRRADRALAALGEQAPARARRRRRGRRLSRPTAAPLRTGRDKTGGPSEQTTREVERRMMRKRK